jgi:hypothetical protein
MSRGDRRRSDTDEARRLLESLRDSEVPDPGERYWSAFPGRVRRAAGSQVEGRWAWLAWPAWGGLAAATVLVLLVWARTDLRQPASPTGPLATSQPSVASWIAASPGAAGPGLASPLEATGNGPAMAEEALEGTLRALAGRSDAFVPAEYVSQLTAEEREALLESLRAELHDTSPAQI